MLFCLVLPSFASHASQQPAGTDNPNPDPKTAFKTALTAADLMTVSKSVFRAKEDDRKWMWLILQNCLTHDDPKVREACIVGIRHYPDKGPEAIRKVLMNDSSPDVRRRAADIIGDLGTLEDIDLLAGFIEKGTSENGRERLLAAEAVSAIGSIGGERALTIIRNVLRDDSPRYPPNSCRSRALIELGAMGDPSDLPLLDKIRRSKDIGLRHYSLSTLAAIAKRHPTIEDEVLRILRESLDDPDYMMRRDAIHQLASFRKPEDVTLIKQMCNDDNRKVREAAESALRSRRARLSPLENLDDPKGRWMAISHIQRNKMSSRIPKLLEVMNLKDSHESVPDKLFAAQTLCEFGNTQWLEPLSKVARNPHIHIIPEDRIHMGVLLARVGDSFGFDILAHYLQHPDWLFRYVTITYLADLSDSTSDLAARATELLQQAATTDPVPSVRQEAITSLERFTEKTPATRAMLLKALQANVDATDDKLREFCRAKRADCGSKPEKN